MDSFNFAILLLLNRNQRKRRKSHNFLVHLINASQLSLGTLYTLMNDLKNDNSKNFNCFRMSKGSFNELLNVLEPHIGRQDTPMMATIPAEERLVMTLRYLLNVIY